MKDTSSEFESVFARRHPVALDALVEHAFVKVVGTVRAIDEPLTAPLSGRPCVYYAFTIEEKVSFGDWAEVVRDEQGEVVIADEGGRVRIEMEFAERDLSNHASEEVTGPFHGPSDALEVAFARYEVEGGSSLTHAYRAIEYVIEPGDILVAAGIVHTEPDPEGGAGEGFRDARKRFVLRSPNEGALYVSDAPSFRT